MNVKKTKVYVLVINNIVKTGTELMNVYVKRDLYLIVKIFVCPNQKVSITVFFFFIYFYIHPRHEL